MKNKAVIRIKTHLLLSQKLQLQIISAGSNNQRLPLLFSFKNHVSLALTHVKYLCHDLKLHFLNLRYKIGRP